MRAGGGCVAAEGVGIAFGVDFVAGVEVVEVGVEVQDAWSSSYSTYP